jgi:hypothetical protein
MAAELLALFIYKNVYNSLDSFEAIKFPKDITPLPLTHPKVVRAPKTVDSVLCNFFVLILCSFLRE